MCTSLGWLIICLENVIFLGGSTFLFGYIERKNIKAHAKLNNMMAPCRYFFLINKISKIFFSFYVPLMSNGSTKGGFKLSQF